MRRSPSDTGLRTRVALRWALKNAGGAAWHASRLLGRAEASLANPTVLMHEQRRRIRSAMEAHDMVDDPDEAYYRDRYWAWIEPELERRGCDLSAVFLDAGCGSGRLALPLAELIQQHGGRVIGVDLLAESVEAAAANADRAGLGNAEFFEGDVLSFLARQPDGTFGAALFLEVGFQVLDLPRHLEELRRVLRPGGLLLASFRTQHYLALAGVLRRDWQLATTVLRSRSGQLRGMGWQNWQSAHDATALLEGSGFSAVELQGMGLCSGIAGDPLAAVAQPSVLGEADLEALASVETELGAAYPDIGRYVLASAVRTT